jgi:hypothetical protein
MSKMAAVDAAVRLQIASDTKTVSYAQAMNVATGYQNEEAVERFLLGVANRLKLDTPSFLFEWATLDAARVMTKTLLVVLSLIEEKTTPVESK